MKKLSILSGGAAQGLVRALEDEFTAATGCRIEGVFGAVGAMRTKLMAGHAADLVILTSAIVRALAKEGLVTAETIADIGGVETALAVRAGDKAPHATDEASLREALLGADAIYVPDLTQSTAGIHVAAVLSKLGIAEQVRDRMRAFPNGATAMAALAKAPEACPIGCTQITEILATPGVAPGTTLPAGFDLKTVYTAGVVAASPNRDAAEALINAMASRDNASLRSRCGFV